MRLCRISISNFKSIPLAGINLTLDRGVLALVGKNNSGKSNIHEAIRLILGSKNPRYAQIPPSAYNDPTQPIRIEAEFSGVNYGVAKAIGLSDAQCAILTKPGKDKEPGHITVRVYIPRSDAEGDSEPEGEEEAPADRRDVEYLLANRSVYKKAEPVRTRLARYIFVPALRDQKEMLAPGGWTSYGALLRNILEDSGKLGDLRRLIEEATAQLRKILKVHSDTLTAAAKIIAYVDSIDFQFTRAGDPVELLRALSILVGYAGRIDEVSDVGTGTQSALIIGILELCLRYSSTPASRVFAIEEPEIYLHPHAQRHLAALIRKLQAEAGTQVIISTHSSHVLHQMDILDVVRVDRDASGATRCHRVSPVKVELDKALRILTVDSNEMVFADRAILVEGPVEKILLPALGRAVRTEDGTADCDFDRRNISIVDVGGKTHFQPYTALLDNLSISWRLVTDRDALEQGISYFLRLAEVSDTDTEDVARRKLREIGVGVLSDGEIEDYYPAEALAEIGGCKPNEVSARVDAHRERRGKAETEALIRAVVQDHRQQIGELTPDEISKSVGAWKREAEDKLQRAGEIATVTRKTSDAISQWLRIGGKPIVAQRVAAWLEANPTKIPPKLIKLTRWLAS
jgi:energy-coupling factor transporter ATP-binding protein EcfA2